MRNDYMKMLVATLVSGVVSGLTLLTVPVAVWVGPGVLFGVSTAVLFKQALGFGWVRSVIWVAACAAAWYAAMFVYLAIASAQNPDNQYSGGGPFSMMLAGLIGGIILASVLSLLTRKLGVGASATIGMGTVLAAAMYGVLMIGSGPNLDNSHASMWQLAVAFAIWQVGVGLSFLWYKRPGGPVRSKKASG